MKYTLCLLIVLLGAITNSYAQNDDKTTRAERVEALRVAFITKELDFSPAESEKFWPLYNEFRKRSKEIMKGPKKLKTSLDNMSDEDIEIWMEARFKADEEKIALQREYIGKLKKIIGIRKVARLKMVEQKFKRTLLERARERKANR
ncbi:MAG: hypothetical protein GY810_12810 [Aureispira sp.]|nr:hypothetical protein [Aureispira sp.]